MCVCVCGILYQDYKIGFYLSNLKCNTVVSIPLSMLGEIPSEKSLIGSPQRIQPGNQDYRHNCASVHTSRVKATGSLHAGLC